MTYFRRTGGQLTLLLLSLVGLAISIYLTAVHYNSQSVPLVCSSSGIVNCENVLTSSYSYVPGTQLPVSIAGIAWFVVSLALAASALFIWQGHRLLRIAEVAWTFIGMLTVFYLVYAEIVRIHAICIWCTSVHIITLIMFLITLLLLQEPVSDEDLEVEEEEPVVPSRRR